MMSTCADLGENEVLVLESHPMTVGRDVDLQRIILTFVATTVAKLKQFWVKRSAKEVEAKVGNFWSNR